ncbi:transposase [Clostridium kluyveri]|uniref:Insertion element IS402-like domain-containing protein n=1 Tax=Clostridium kluyveri TaxID=1534 RepID=A0A1L5F410_CLOKL|nr:hypothetical protein BS101_02700 [Clostridium kluyveri]
MDGNILIFFTSFILFKKHKNTAKFNLEAILYVLRTGVQWKALPKEKFGASSSIHRYFMA